MYNAMNAVYQATLQLLPARIMAREKMKRVTKILLYCLGLVVMVGVVMGGGAVLFGPKLLQIYTSDPEVISYGMMRMRIINGFSCAHHGYHGGRPARSGYSDYLNRCLPVPCGMDFFCIRQRTTPTTLYTSYPVSWIIIAHGLTSSAIVIRFAARRKATD